MSDSKIQIKTKSLPNSRIAIDFEVPAKECKRSFEDSLSILSKSANLPGFRKGKVPKTVILQQLGSKRIQATALEKLLEKIWKQALEDKSFKPICDPELSGGFDSLLETFNIEKPLFLTLEADVPPSPKLKITKGLIAESETTIFKESKVDELIEQSQKQLATVVPVENRPAAKGDIAVLSFNGTFTDDGSEIEGGKGDSMDIELEEGRMIPGFIEGVYGMKINEEKTIDCIFPKDYQDEKAKGRKAKFEVQLKDLKTRELPELDDSFAKQAADKENMKELRDDLTSRLKEDVKRNNLRNRQESLLNALVEQLEVDLPKTLINEEIKNLIEQTARTFAQQGMDVKSTFTPELVNSLMESSKPEAESNLRKSLAITALAEQENIEVDKKTLEKKLSEVQKELGNEKNIDQQKLRQAVIDDLLQEKVFEWLEENNTVKEKKGVKKSKSSEKTSKQEKNKQTKTDKINEDTPEQ